MRTVFYRGLCSAALIYFFTGNVFAGGFQLWEQNVTSVENFHAGRAVLANDASTAYDNPAGITRIKNQQVVFGAMGVFSSIKYNGLVETYYHSTLMSSSEGSVGVETFTPIPDFHYVAPINADLGFGLSVVAPYGDDVEYGMSSFVSSIVTRARLQVIDITPSLGFNVNKQLSLGLGFDIEKMSAELDSIFTNPIVTKGFDTAYGYHLGALYEWSPATRVGLAYHSKVVHQLKGTSNWIGTSYWDRASTSLYLPSDTTLSVYQRLNSKWAMMGTVVYTQWGIINNLVIHNIAGLAQNGIPYLDFPMNFQNTWTFSVGADYAATDKLTLRAGTGYDESPTRNQYRILQLPDSSRYDFSIGGHYQLLKTLGFDLGWTRVFLKEAPINSPLHTNLTMQQAPVGTVHASADVVGAQVTWDII